jgi:hypothetical protein
MVMVPPDSTETGGGLKKEMYQYMTMKMDGEAEMQKSLT